MVGHVARAGVDVAAPPARVWQALTDPDMVEQYMFGSRVQTDWQQGSSIVWSGEYDGKPFEDNGEVVDVVPEQRLEVTHFSPLGGKPDEPENYHTLLYQLEETDGGTHLSLEQDNNDSEEEAESFAENWSAMLQKLQEVVERG